MTLEEWLPTRPPAADYRRDSQMAGCRSPEKERPGLDTTKGLAETVRVKEEEEGDGAV